MVGDTETSQGEIMARFRVEETVFVLGTWDGSTGVREEPLRRRIANIDAVSEEAVEDVVKSGSLAWKEWERNRYVGRGVMIPPNAPRKTRTTIKLV